MKLIYLKRGNGKTTEMVEWFLEEPRKRILLVIHRYEKERIVKILKEKNQPLAYQTVLTFNEIDHLDGFSPDVEVGIDNMDYFVHHLFKSKYGKHITIASLSEDNNL